MRVAIIGAGWTGCHLALSLQRRGVDVTVFEQNATPFAGASGHNQNRLHLGFHYPRSYATIEGLAQTFQAFRREYPTLVAPIQHNLYAVADADSILDFRTFCSILSTHGLHFVPVSARDFGLEHCEGVVTCEEAAIDNVAAAKYFQRALGKTLRLQSPVTATVEDLQAGRIGAETFDRVLNCTYNLFHPLSPQDFKYEVCVIFEYRSSTFGRTAVTIMDGPFCSIYPVPSLSNDRFTLSGVLETAIGSFETPRQAQAALKTVTEKALQPLRERMAAKMARFLPRFAHDFTYVAPHLSLKTKPKEEADARRWHRIQSEQKLVTIFGSKITNIFPIESEVCELLQIGAKKGKAAA